MTRVTGKKLSKLLTTIDELHSAGLISASEQQALPKVAERYAVAVTPAMAGLIDKQDPADPIARQFIPTLAELEASPEEHPDPIGDNLKSPVRGIVHRYADRVLLKPVHVCPVYCRFCFRREMVGPDNEVSLSETELDRACEYIAETPEIWEVIITGGDPLILSPRRIQDLNDRLARIDHVKVIRWHTRVPVVQPSALDNEKAEALASSAGKAVYVAVHSNHPHEITDAAKIALDRLSSRNISLIGQTVLLRGVNDDTDTLEKLMRRFVEAGVLPYYLHHPDLAPGTRHFRVSIAEGQSLVRALSRRLSGIAMPTYVLDIPGAHGKVRIGPGAIEADGEAYVLTDRHGKRHTYFDRC